MNHEKLEIITLFVRDGVLHQSKTKKSQQAKVAKKTSRLEIRKQSFSDIAVRNEKIQVRVKNLSSLAPGLDGIHSKIIYRPMIVSNYTHNRGVI